ncbi:MAG: hypothetical protein LBJ46_07560 [Planctomycetota bacterium]|nr:hypothetical protein [Planctomycetota bacterium]
MIEDADKRDEQWGVLLSRCYEKVEAGRAFRQSLLDELRAKVREYAESVEEAQELEDDEESRDIGSEENWSAFLTGAYEPCEPNLDFKASLILDLKDRQRSLVDTKNETVIQELLSTSYDPVQPRREFETRLLENLKHRQKTRIIYKQTIRRRSIFSAVASGLAAAAAVLFVVWLGPVDFRDGSSASQPITSAAASAVPEVVVFENLKVEPVAISASDATENVGIIPAVPAAPVLAAFASRLLPKTAVGLGMELDDGSGWRPMDESILTRVSPGMAFRSTESTAIIDFDDGANILLRPGAVVRATESGLDIERGELAVSVPSQVTDSLRIVLGDREVAVQPGTMLAVNAHNPDLYAVGGAPAPEVMVADGGLALARGRAGVGPLFANQAYLIGNYVTPDLPGRPLCAVECEALERDFAPVFDDYGENGMTQMVSAPAASFTPRAPIGYRAEDGRLIAESYENQDTTKVRYLSDEYFGLANARRDLATSLALGSELILDGGNGVFYEIYK